MTEAEWLGDAHAQHMVLHLRSLGLPRTKAGRRRLRLFACGCCRVAWGLLPAGPIRDAVSLAESFADGLATKAGLAAAKAGATASAAPLTRSRAAAAELVADACYPSAYDAAFAVTCYGNSLPGRFNRQSLSDVARCAFGNPFRPVALDPAWLTADAVGLAGAIYDARTFHDLPILADALQDAGCDDAAVLGHCRGPGPGPHARGCWVVDLVLGRA